MTTDQRIENLEKGLASARRFNRWLLAAGGLALGVWILAGTFGPTMAAAPAGGDAVKEVGANCFVVVDENGKVRALLAVAKDGPRLDLCDENGKCRARFGLNKNGPVLALTDENGKPRAMMDVTKNGPQLYLLDENGRGRIVLAADKDGPGLDLRDENGNTRARLAVNKDGPQLYLADEKGKTIWQALQSAPVAGTPRAK